MSLTVKIDEGHIPTRIEQRPDQARAFKCTLHVESLRFNRDIVKKIGESR